MKVKLLEPIEGYEDVAEWRVPKAGESFVGDDGEIYTVGNLARYPYRFVLTPKPLPVVEPPKWLGCVQWQDQIVRVSKIQDAHGSSPFIQGLTDDGSLFSSFRLDDCALIRTANIPTAPELEALFKEPQ